MDRVLPRGDRWQRKLQHPSLHSAFRTPRHRKEQTLDDKIRVGVLGLTHDHVWEHLPSLQASPRAELVGVADPHEDLIERAANEYGCSTYSDYEVLLDSESLDAVLVFADNSQSVDLCVEASHRGLHQLVEKPLAGDLVSADLMIAAAASQGVRLMVNWPFAWWPQMQQAVRMAKDGVLGDIWQVRYRAAHAGPREMGCSDYFCDWLFNEEQNGGGAMVDYCCYGALLSAYLLGCPSRVSGVKGRLTKDDITVEDNAILVMTYPRAISVAEGSWSEVGNLSNYFTYIYGTHATLMIEPHSGGRLMLATMDNPQGQPVEMEPAPAHWSSATDHFLECLANEEPFFGLCGVCAVRDAQEILEAGLWSAQRGKEISIPLRDGEF